MENDPINKNLIQRPAERKNVGTSDWVFEALYFLPETFGNIHFLSGGQGTENLSYNYSDLIIGVLLMKKKRSKKGQL
jgi:hypothetical protein